MSGTDPVAPQEPAERPTRAAAAAHRAAALCGRPFGNARVSGRFEAFAGAVREDAVDRRRRRAPGRGAPRRGGTAPAAGDPAPALYCRSVDA